jgi:hypothetical protein
VSAIDIQLLAAVSLLGSYNRIFPVLRLRLIRRPAPGTRWFLPFLVIISYLTELQSDISDLFTIESTVRARLSTAWLAITAFLAFADVSVAHNTMRHEPDFGLPSYF